MKFNSAKSCNFILAVFIIFSGLIIIFALFANHFGFDPNNGWGPRRIFTLTFGLIIFLTSIFLRSKFFINAFSKNFKTRNHLVRLAFIPISYAIIAIAFLSPLASGRLVPGEYDFGVHINHIVDARLALDEGQFPIRIAPNMNRGYRYPLFQFYSPFPYTFAGLIYKFYTPDNAFLAYRFMVFLALFISGIYICRISYHLSGSLRPSFLSGIIYMTAPYFIINIHARSAWTEVIAQGILPMVLFYTLKLHSTKKQEFIIAASLSWFVLCTTHLITFVYTAFFIGIFIVLISIPLKKNFRPLILSFSPILIACLLAWYFLEPVIFVPVWIKSFTNPFGSNWLTPIFTLLSPVSIPPEPQPGVLSQHSPGLHTAVGWIILLGVAYTLFIIFMKDDKWEQTRGKKIVLTLFGIFILAFFMTWSPIDFWKYLPQPLYITQFTYRIATHTMWSGAILSSFAIHYLFNTKKLSDLSIILGILIIVMSNASWLNIQNIPPITVVSAMQSPVGQNAYQYQLNSAYPPQIPDQTVDNIKDNCHQEQKLTVCNINATNKKSELVQFPVYYYPDMLEVLINGKISEYFPTRQEDTNDPLLGVNIEPGDNQVSIQFTGLKSANVISIITWTVMISWILLLLLLRGKNKGLNTNTFC